MGVLRNFKEWKAVPKQSRNRGYKILWEKNCSLYYNSKYVGIYIYNLYVIQIMLTWPLGIYEI